MVGLHLRFLGQLPGLTSPTASEASSRNLLPRSTWHLHLYRRHPTQHVHCWLYKSNCGQSPDIQHHRSAPPKSEQERSLTRSSERRGQTKSNTSGLDGSAKRGDEPFGRRT